jgi:hypothetical protein
MNAAYTIEDQEQLAYLAGDVRTAALLGRIAELEAQVRLLEDQIEDTMTLEEWENRNGPGHSYVQFFHDCFERLSGHYPSPSVTSDYDKSIILEAIERGEEANSYATDESRSYGPGGNT